MTDEQIMSGFKRVLREQMSKLSFAEKLACADIIVLINRQKEKIKEFDRKIVIQQGMIDYQKAEIEELKEKHATDERVLNDRIQESVNAVSEADQKYICTLERSIAAKDVEIERLLQKLQQAKSKAIKEFAKRLEYRIWRSPQSDIATLNIIGNLMKEMKRGCK